MLAVIEVNVNIFLLAGLTIFSVIIGYIFRGNQGNSLKRKINELENEILSSHAEILQLQKEKIDLLKTISEPSIPVISITAAKEELANEKLPDASARKKLLGSHPAIKQQSGG